MSEIINNPSSPETKALPVNGEVRIDLQMSNLISLDEVREKRKADRLAEAAHPTVEVEVPPTILASIGRRSLNLATTRHNEAA